MRTGRRAKDAVFAALLLAILMAVQAAAQTLVPLTGHVPRRVQGATLVGRVSPNEQIDLSLVVHVDDAAIKGALTRMYGRNAPANKRFLNSGEFAQTFGLAQKRAQLKQFAQSFGLNVKISEDRPESMVVKVAGSARAIEQAFGIQLNQYRDAAGEFRAHQTDPLVPDSIRPHLSAVLGLSNITGVFHPNVESPGASDQLKSSALPGTAPGGGLAPSEYQTVYSVNPSAANGAGQTAAVLELAAFDPSDFATYTSQFNLPNIPLTVIGIDGFVNTCPSSGCANGSTEVDLDTQLIAAGAPGIAGILVYDAPNSSQGAMDAYDQMATDNLAQVLTTCWGQGEPELEASFIQAENQIFQRMALQGQSIFAASGDGGSYAGGSGQSSVQDPSAQPYVTGVGGTSLSGTVQAPIETAWIGSGGGISGVWELPDYQDGLTGAASQQFRNVPDVALNAALASGYGIFANGQWTTLAGTSAAAPLWAALTACINQQRLAGGIPALGFANPTLYELAASSEYSSLYRDIVSGNNGFYSAGPGYDNVTGWGSYLGAALLNAAAQVSTFVTLYSPAAGQFLPAEVTIGGSASSPVFTNYFVEYGVGAQPSSFSVIGGIQTSPVSFGLLGTWNTSGLSSGTYALRLTMTEASGQTISTTASPLYIDTIPPTAPAQVTLVPQSTTSLTLSWTPSTDNFGVAGYKIDLSTYSSFFTYVTGYQSFNWPASSPTSLVITSLNPGTTYYARVRAYDAAGNVSANSPVAQAATIALPPPPVVVPNVANYDSALMAPACLTVGAACDSGTLLNGRFNLSGGAEPNGSNTLFNSCVDGNYGTYHVDESNDRLQIASLDSQPFAAGQTVRITATVWAYSNYNVDFLDLYSAPDANSPVWTFLGTLQPPAPGVQVLSLTYTLPNGSLQAIRANFRFSGKVSTCTAGGYNDHDDLVFAVGSTASSLPAPVITSGLSATGTAGSNFSYTITASNTPASFNAVGLPAGVTVNTTTGLISGVPGATGVFPVNLSATNSGGTGTAVLSLTVNPALLGSPVITSSTSGSGTVGSNFSYTITATNNPTSFNAAGLPSWLSINTATGVISGVPVSTGTLTVTLTATNSSGSGTGSLTLTISPAPPPQVPVAAFTVTPQTGSAPLTVTCDASASTGGDLSYAWNFGDHTIGFGRVITHTYSTPGFYGITVTVSNTAGSANMRNTVNVSGSAAADSPP